MFPKSLSRNGWTIWHLLGAALMVGLGVLVTLPAWADIYQRARKDEESSHIFLVPIIALWLVWVRRGRGRLCQPAGMFIGPPLVLLGWLISSWGEAHAIESFWHGGSVLVVVGCLLSVLGKDVLYYFLPAFAVLVFLVPVPGTVRQQVAIPLQSALAQATQVLFEMAGVEVDRSGNMLSINGTPVAIAEACNGMRMVFALVLVSFAFAFSQPLRGYTRVLILVASPVSAIFCNALRMVPTVWLYGHASADFADRFHDIAGWIMLFVAFLVLLSIVYVLRWASIPVSRYTLAYD